MIVLTKKDTIEKAREITSLVTEGATIFDEESEARVPRFKRSELTLGSYLGRGGFSSVHEIQSVEISDSANDDIRNKCVEIGTNEVANDHRILQDRKFISTRYDRNGKARYALKTLHGATRNDSEMLMKGIVDLVIEVKFLSVLNHPNIIKIRAVADGDPINLDYFLVLDRLQETLTVRLKGWKKKEGQLNNFFMKIVDRYKKKRDNLFVSRLQVAYDIASAFDYLHSLDIIYRDMKPENIGFDVRGDVKIFDFGLATQKKDKIHVGNGLYNMSGKTGSLRYMAPEVFSGKPYNHTIDVFAFGVLLWQICSLKLPYSDFDVNMYEEYVVGNGFRPEIDSKWSPELKSLMESSWSVKISERPQMEDVVQSLQTEMNNRVGEIYEGCMSRTAKSM